MMIRQSQNRGITTPAAESGQAAENRGHGNSPPSAVKTDLGTRARGLWLLPLMLGAVLAGMLLSSQPWTQQDQPGSKSSAKREGQSAAMATADTSADGGWVPAPRPPGKTVALTIDFGNGATRGFAALPWSDGMTLADLMEIARRFRPSITYTQKCAGAQAFLTALEGVAHQANQGNFWFYQINGKRGTRSFGIQPLQP